MGNLNLTVVPTAIGRESEGLLSERRQEVRVDGSKVCAYSLCESIEGERVLIEQGEVCSLNRSEHGILRLTGSWPRNAATTSGFGRTRIQSLRLWEYAVNLFTPGEVQWTKVLPVESHGIISF